MDRDECVTFLNSGGPEDAKLRLKKVEWNFFLNKGDRSSESISLSAKFFFFLSYSSGHSSESQIALDRDTDRDMYRMDLIKRYKSINKLNKWSDVDDWQQY